MSDACRGSPRICRIVWIRLNTRGRADSGRVLIVIFLEAGEDVPDFLGSPQIGNGIGNGVLLF
jgi:hypothetical protein